MKRRNNSAVTYRTRHEDKCHHAAHAAHNIAARETGCYHDHQKSNDCTCPRCGRTTRPNMFVCPHCGMHLATPKKNISKRAVQAEVHTTTGIRAARPCTVGKSARPMHQKRQRYMSEEMAAELAATIPTIAVA